MTVRIMEKIKELWLNSKLKYVIPPTLALVLVGMANLVTKLLLPYTSTSPFSIFYLAILVAAIYGSACAGRLAVLLSLVFVDYYFLVPLNAFSLSLNSVLGLGIFGIVAMAQVFLVERLRRSEANRRYSELLLLEKERLTSAAYKKAHQQIDRILESVTDAFVTLDRNWCYTYVNERAARILNRRREDLIGKHIWTEFPEGVGQPYHHAYERAMNEGISIQFENYYISNDRWLENRIYPSPDGISIVLHDVTDRKTAQKALEEHAMRLQAMSRQLLDVQENERRLLARDLHDTVGQELTALSFNLTMMRSAIPAELAGTVGSRLDDSQKLLEETTQHLRNVMVDLRPPGIDELGLLAALKDHAQRVARRGGFKLVVNGAELKPRLESTMEIALFRIAQEALNNTVKHANATDICIGLQEKMDHVSLVVADNGRGFNAKRNAAISPFGMGMTTMRERAEAICAELRIESDVGQGTQITVEISRTISPVAPKRSGL